MNPGTRPPTLVEKVCRRLGQLIGFLLIVAVLAIVLGVVAWILKLVWLGVFG